MRPAKTFDEHFLAGTKSQVKPSSPSQTAVGARAAIPSHLTPAERSVFKNLHKILEGRRTVTDGDYLALAQAATLTVRWVKAKKDVEKRGMVVKVTVLDSHGQPVTQEKLNLNLKIAQQSEKELRVLLTDLGLTPSTREKVKPAKPVESTKKDEPPHGLVVLNREGQEV